MRNYTIQYLFNDAPRTHQLQLNQSELSVADAAMHLVELHFGDGENSLVMPTADSTAEEILQQAEVMGITQIEVVT
ncbi:hypothetical protein [Pseudomonas sp. RIT288]|jgi:hypothetical protein|uniref:hypothetical protein n=1 Tax=Pseudomonas sp. RIT288 TaxID=1470589 RepID=UPI000449FCBC|nr:hypothetical protein [Pseudomonas sp. RIT288]EZP32282.1 hypothetical protein BW33_01902 [Pseudomonas sp. RIT288]